MKSIDLKRLSGTQIEILQLLVVRALYDFGELDFDEQQHQKEILGYNPAVELERVKSWLTFNV